MILFMIHISLVLCPFLIKNRHSHQYRTVSSDQKRSDDDDVVVAGGGGHDVTDEHNLNRTLVAPYDCHMDGDETDSSGSVHARLV